MIDKTRRRVLPALAISTAAALALTVTAPAYAANTPDTSALREAVTAANIIEHLDALQAVADANGGNRAAGLSGHEQSAEYVESQLQAAGYTTTRQEFSYNKVVVDVAALDVTAPTPASYTYFDEFYPMDFTGQGDVTAPVTAVDVNITGDRASTSGCEAEDFAGFPAGNIALIQRGSCDFSVKAANAVNAGASAVVVFNQGNENPADDRFGVVFGTLGVPFPIPVVGTTFAIGEAAVNTPGTEMRVALRDPRRADRDVQRARRHQRSH